MLKLVTGRASSGKTSYLRKLIAQEVLKGNSPVLIVPEQFSFESEKAVIEILGAKKAGEVKILSFTSLGKKILDLYAPAGKPSVTEASEAVIMSMALEALSEKLEIFGKCAENINSVKGLIGITKELIQCGVTAESINEAAVKSKNSILIQKAKELELISEMYKTLLTGKFSDDRYTLNRAAEIIREKKLFAGRLVFFDEFTGFTAQEQLVLGEILKQAEDVYVAHCADGIKDYTNGTGAFSYSIKNIGKLFALAKKCGVSIAEPVVLKGSGGYANESLSFIEKGFYETEPEIYNKPAPEITVAAAKNPYDECDFAAMTAKKLVREKGFRYRDMVVVSRSADYAEYLPFSFKKYDIPVFEDKRKSLEKELIVKYAQAALSAAAEGFSTDTVMKMLKTYIFDIDKDDISLLENYVLVWQIDRGGWLKEWTGHPGGLGREITDDDRKTLEKINELRVRVVSPLERLKEELKDKDGFGCTKAVYDFLIYTKADKGLLNLAGSLENKLAGELQRSWDEFMNALSLLGDTVGERNITPLRYYELFKIMMTSSDMGELPGGLDRITIGDADRIRVTDKKVLFIVGANDGIFPMAAAHDFVLNDSERRILKLLGLELNGDSVETAQKERLRVYSTVSIPGEMLFVSYSMSDFGGQNLIPSEIVTMTEKIVPMCNKTEISLLEPMYRIESRQSAFEWGAAHYSDDTVFARSVKKYLSEESLYSDMMESVSRAAEKKEIKFSEPKKAENLFGKDMFITPSRVEEFYKCPFKYFCRYGVKAKPLEKASFDNRQTGLYVHYVLERIFARFGSSGIVKLTEEERRKAVKEETDNYIENHMGGAAVIRERELYAIRRSEKTVNEILERLVMEFSQGKFKTRDVELKIGFEEEVKPYILNIGDGGSVYLSGVVDRVDTMDSENGEKTYLRVIDYKTGGKEFNLKDVLSGLNLQMLVYLMCLFENGKDKYGNVVPAGILYVPAKKGSNELPRDATVEEIEKKRKKQGRMNGIILDDPEVIEGMEGDEGGFISGISYDSKGKVKGSVFDMGRFKLLHKTIDDIVVNMAKELHRGSVQAVPIRDGNYKNTCDYCEYKAVCCYEEGDEYRTLFSGDPWEEMEGESNG